ncbi:hypothetical protein SDC9_158592 [bioreactor metagenome]|uniref:Uncharacterized protein n=1 Tax=bioreactor metagenome TaxID=1076179 RepID=A0A645FAF5_9ZZZZ
MYDLLWMDRLHVFLDLVSLVGTDNEYVLSVFDAREGSELFKSMVQHGFAGQVKQWLGSAPGKRPHSGSKTGHGDYDLKV